MSSVQIGNAGEHYVMACLLAQGFHAGLADRGNPHFDILVRTKSGEFCAIRVKTSRSDSFQWTAKEEWNPLPGFDTKNPDHHDISVLIAFNNQPPGLQTEVYVIPTARLVEDINWANRHYHNYQNRDGSMRKRSSQRVLRLDGAKRPDNIAYGLRDDWREFRDAWRILNARGERADRTPQSNCDNEKADSGSLACLVEPSNFEDN